MRQPEDENRDKLMALLDAVVNASHDEVFTCGHYYAKRVVNERPSITSRDFRGRWPIGG